MNAAPSTHDDSALLARRLIAAAKQAERPLGGSDRGISVEVGRGEIGIDFDYNPRLARLAGRIPGFAFHPQAKIWAGPLEEYDLARVAIDRMRSLNARLIAARESIEAEAASIAVGSKIQDAFTKEGAFYVGRILAVNEFFCAQENGAGYVKVHDLARMKSAPKPGESLYFKYVDGGKSVVSYPAREKPQDPAGDRND